MGLLGDKAKSSSAEDMLLMDDLVKLYPQVQEANAMSEELDRRVRFELVLMSPQGRGLRENEGRTEVYISLTNLDSGNEFFWSKDKFSDRKYLMRDMYQNYMEGESWKLPQEKDPFWEPADSPLLIGTCHVYLQSLAYLIEVAESFSVTDFRGEDQGKLEIELRPCDSEWRELGEEFSEPDDVIGQAINFKVKLNKGHDLSPKYAAVILLASTSSTWRTSSRRTPEASKAVNPQFKFEKKYTFKPVTKQLMDYLQNSYTHCRTVWAAQKDSGKKSSKTTKELMQGDKPKQGAAGDSRPAPAGPAAASAEAKNLKSELDTLKRKSERKTSKKLSSLQTLVNEARKSGKDVLQVDKVDKILSATAASLSAAGGQQRRQRRRGCCWRRRQVGQLGDEGGGEAQRGDGQVDLGRLQHPVSWGNPVRCSLHFLTIHPNQFPHFNSGWVAAILSNLHVLVRVHPQQCRRALQPPRPAGFSLPTMLPTRITRRGFGDSPDKAGCRFFFAECWLRLSGARASGGGGQEQAGCLASGIGRPSLRLGCRRLGGGIGTDPGTAGIFTAASRCRAQGSGNRKRGGQSVAELRYKRLDSRLRQEGGGGRRQRKCSGGGSCMAGSRRTRTGPAARPAAVRTIDPGRLQHHGQRAGRGRSRDGRVVPQQQGGRPRRPAARRRCRRVDRPRAEAAAGVVEVKAAEQRPVAEGLGQLCEGGVEPGPAAEVVTVGEGVAGVDADAQPAVGVRRCWKTAADGGQNVAEL
uniref:KIF1B domain-containing protein n=1 Tax=Macrostomum lignano TaxID=282301 RepID=A0A1I8JN26_9PLAT